MPRWLRWTLWIIAGLIVLSALAYWWLILEDGRPQNGTFALDIARIRALADEKPGGKTTEIHVETVATMTFPATAAFAGGDWTGLPMSVLSYQFILPEETIVLDAAVNEPAARTLDATFDPRSFQRMSDGIRIADQVIITHEHRDHISGILFYMEIADLKPRLRLTTEQIVNAERYSGFSLRPPILRGAPELAYDDYYALAPGVVLIKAPGHTPGSQMVFVERADGSELLFIGDIGWSMKNVEEVRGRARLVGDWLLGEDRNAVFAQLDAINALHAAEPGIVIVPGHDRAVIEALIADGTLLDQFALPDEIPLR